MLSGLDDSHHAIGSGRCTLKTHKISIAFFFRKYYKLSKQYPCAFCFEKNPNLAFLSLEIHNYIMPHEKRSAKKRYTSLTIFIEMLNSDSNNVF